jgi:hypothetical protein
MRRGLLWGLVAAAAYVAAALALSSAGVPVLPVFDGLAPPAPYRWVSPPPDLAAQNDSPYPGLGSVSLGRKEPFTVATRDGQAEVSGSSNAFPSQHGARSVRIAISPLDPETIGPPPKGLAIVGNAYRFRADYSPCCGQATLQRRVTIMLRFPTRSTELVRWSGRAWEREPARVVGSTLQIFGTPTRLGIFAAAGPRQRGRGPSLLTWVAVVLAALALFMAALTWYLRRRRERGGGRRSREQARPRRTTAL